MKRRGLNGWQSLISDGEKCNMISMKQVQCLDCEKIFENEVEMNMLLDMQKHYLADHNEIITGVDEAGKVAWMIEFTKRWNAN